MRSKAEQFSKVLSGMFISKEEGRCPFCDADLTKVTSDNWQEYFRDELSYKEFEISGLCMKCQDGTFEE